MPLHRGVGGDDLFTGRGTSRVENRRSAPTFGRVRSPRPTPGEDEDMRFMLLQAYGGVELEGCQPMYEWDPADVRAHIDFQHTLNTELLERGELVDAQGLATPDQAKVVVSDGMTPPKVIDG